MIEEYATGREVPKIRDTVLAAPPLTASTHFGQNITRLAGMFGLTQSQFAQAVGVTPQTSSLWRTGREPSTSAMLRISELFELPASKLFTAEFADLMPSWLTPTTTGASRRISTVPFTVSRAFDSGTPL